MSQPSTEKSETIFESVKAIEADCRTVEGIAEYKVYVEENSISDDIAEGAGIRRWVEHAVENHLERELSKEGHDVVCHARASDITEDRAVTDADLESSVSVYSVWAKFR
ncbi:hypothetical protein B4589_004345 [Halolamina sp. CBA1230]|jgi:hypothetical protein|uniref:hypothetical protein n=1 Tax=Halolamina sp. CBA1230 TaxID=1853690 RepID=UPI001179E32F|nr:hypothetical protein [Halolamina sp. CBA1230]QKY19646.1 hypothetical protein B4589_004345 [Halolamina sp. CBA1230]